MVNADKERDLKTTKKHFETFIEASKSWIATFGLLGWEVDFSHEELEARGQFDLQ